MKIRSYFLLIFLSVVFVCQPLYSQGIEVQVVVNASNSVESMSQKEVSRLFMKQVTRWKDGTEAVPVDLSLTSPVRKQFSKAILGKNISTVKGYWLKKVMSGRDNPPPAKASEREVLEFVQNNPGAIGYVSSNMKIQNYDVKVLKVTE